MKGGAFVFAFALVPGLAGAGDPAPVSFEDVSGLIPFEHASVAFGGDGLAGAAWLDYDADGDLDLYLANGKTQDDALFRNDAGTFVDVSESAGIENGSGSSGVAAADIDNDGYPDLFLSGDGGFLGTGDTPVTLFHNQQDGTFDDITSTSGIAGAETNLSAAFGDIDNDGYLDLFVTASGSLGTMPREQHTSTFYHNQGDLTFSDISSSSGAATALGGCVAFFTDYDDDGWIDLFVGNCNDIAFTPTPIELFRNNGNLTFSEVGEEAGVDTGGLWMGFGPADYDNDGDIDIFVTNLGGNNFGLTHALYRNEGDGSYTDVGAMAGLALAEFGWGTSFKDFDNDGWPDLFYTGAFPNMLFPGAFLANPGHLFFNGGDGAFQDFSSTLPVSLLGVYDSGVAAGDYDEDGFVDLLVARTTFDGSSGQPYLLRNVGNANGSVTIDLEGTASNRDGVGARVHVRVGKVTQTQEVYAGSSFASTDSPWLVFGVGDAETTDEIRVRWPDGHEETYANAAAGERVTLVEVPEPGGLASSVCCLVVLSMLRRRRRGQRPI